MSKINVEIYDKAQILAEAIGASAELHNLKESEREMLANSEAQEIISRFQDMQHRLSEQEQQGLEVSEEDKEAVAKIEDTVEKHPLISAYLQAQDKFTEMLDSVNAVLAGAIASGEPAEGGCSSCGVDGCESCHSGC